MTTYSYAQLERLWISAGGPADLAPVAAAIAEAESGGNSDAVNRTDNGGTQSSYGLWQISNGTHAPPSPQWSNPAVNAQLAVGKWRAGPAGGSPHTFGDWGTFTSGAYTAFLSPGTTPAGSVPGSPTAAASASASTGSDATCAWSVGWGGIAGTSWLNDIFGSGGNVGAGEICLLSKPAARAWLGAVLLGAGAVVATTGLVLVTGIAVKSEVYTQLLGPVVKWLNAGAKPPQPTQPQPQRGRQGP